MSLAPPICPFYIPTPRTCTSSHWKGHGIDLIKQTHVPFQRQSNLDVVKQVRMCGILFVILSTIKGFVGTILKLPRMKFI